MNNLNLLVSKLNSLLDSLAGFKKELDKDGFSLEKISIVIPSLLAFIRSLTEISGIKEELKDVLKDDDKIIELVKIILSLKNSIIALVNTFKDPESVQLLLSALESLEEKKD